MANNVLELRGKRFVQASRKGGSGGASMNSQRNVTASDLSRLQSKVEQIKNFWRGEARPFQGILISVHYSKIAAKSNRIAGLLKGTDSNEAVVGAKFNTEKTCISSFIYIFAKELRI